MYSKEVFRKEITEEDKKIQMISLYSHYFKAVTTVNLMFFSFTTRARRSICKKPGNKKNNYSNEARKTQSKERRKKRKARDKKKRNESKRRQKEKDR